MRVHYPYGMMEGRDRRLFPLVDIRLTGIFASSTFSALVDSGSECSAVPKGVEIMGLLKYGAAEVSGIGGGGVHDLVRGHVQLLFRKRPLFDFGIVELVSIPNLDHIILGRDTIFTVFKVVFDERNHETILETH